MYVLASVSGCMPSTELNVSRIKLSNGRALGAEVELTNSLNSSGYAVRMRTDAPNFLLSQQTM